MAGPMEVNISTQARASKSEIRYRRGSRQRGQETDSSWRARQVPFGGIATLGIANL